MWNVGQCDLITSNYRPMKPHLVCGHYYTVRYQVLVNIHKFSCDGVMPGEISAATFLTEQSALNSFATKRWNGQVTCLYCGSMKMYKSTCHQLLIPPHRIPQFDPPRLNPRRQLLAWDTTVYRLSAMQPHYGYPTAQFNQIISALVTIPCVPVRVFLRHNNVYPA